MSALTSIDPSAGVGPVILRVRDAAALADWYRRALGLVPLASEGSAVVLGASDGTPILVLSQDRSAPAARRGEPGLYHVAVLMPARADLGRWLLHAAEAGIALQGAADHLVSEAVYLADPEGNGIEVYRDRPRDEWPRDGDRVRMANARLDADGIVGSARAEGGRYDGAPAGTTVGHVHLKVADLDATRAFWEGAVGLDVTNDSYPSALFASAGGYHHHFGYNTWESAGGRRTVGSAGLEAVTLTLPEGALAPLAARLEAAGMAVGRRDGAAAAVDPSGNGLLIVEGDVDAARALALAAP